MIEVDAVVDPFFVGGAHHLARLFDLVGDRLFAEHMFARFQTLHGWLKMVAAILFAGAADADGVDLFVLQQLFDAIVGFDPIALGGLIGALFDNVTDGNELDRRVGLVDGCMGVANPTQTDYSDFQCHDRLLFLAENLRWLRLDGTRILRIRRIDADCAR